VVSRLDPTTVVAGVADPEMPELTLADLGVVRSVSVIDGQVQVTLTPTFTGCPATSVMRDDVTNALHDAGWHDVDVRTVLDPAWTTEWITSVGRAKLAAAGIGAPPSLAGGLEQAMLELVACPRCGSRRTHRRSLFGSSLCRDAHVCDACGEPFERVKPI
jgi:ring-1,2-phenylacetyl-CoA epoxidase subunit PaaD